MRPANMVEYIPGDVVLVRASVEKVEIIGREVIYTLCPAGNNKSKSGIKTLLRCTGEDIHDVIEPAKDVEWVDKIEIKEDKDEA